MNYRFSDIRFQQFVQDARRVKRQYGQTVARNLYRRINVIMNAAESSDLFEAAGRFHELSGTRKGDFVFDLSGSMRLIVRFENERQTAVIIQIEDYH